MADGMRYELRLYDTVLMAFTVRRDVLGELTATADWTDESKLPLFPPQLQLDRSSHAIVSWLTSRIIPKNRAFVDRILLQAGIVPGDTLGIVDACKGLATTDSYWVVPEGFPGTWHAYNLFENDLDEVLSLVAYTGVTDSQRKAAGISTEWTTNGSYPKAWRRIDGELVLYKAGNYPLFEGTANEDLGPFSEYFSAQIAEACGIPHVAYGLDRWKGHLASTCRLFNSADVAYVPFHQAVGAVGIPQTLAIFAALDDKAFAACLDMLVFDALICNTDRHTGNFGFLRSNATGAYLGTAPLFDHNMALFPTDMPDDFPTWADKAGHAFPAGSHASFDALAATALLPEHHAWCRRLLSFEFEHHGRCPIAADRLGALTAYVRERARRLLDLPSHELAEVRATVQSTAAYRSLNFAAMPLFAQK